MSLGTLSSIREVLHRELYRGVIVYNGTKKRDQWGRKRQRDRPEAKLIRLENVAKLKRQGRSLEEAIAAKPTAAYDEKWGQFVITPALFTKLVYEGV